MRPLQRYEAALEGGEITPDDLQRRVMTLLDDLFGRLHEQTAGSLFGRVKSLFSAQAHVRGLYLWGGVGRGKTMLMDLFCECLDESERQRMHFHRFMQRVHNELTTLKGTANPLHKVADRLIAEGRVICFDEFFVSDIGDAMILGEVFAALFERGAVLVATSNVEPANLYANGLQRSRFLPAIDLLYEHTEVYHVDGDTDYRLRVLEKAELYHHPLDDAAVTSLARSFDALCVEQPQIDQTIEILGREIRAARLADDVAWFEFSELCEGPRSQNDYIELAREFHTVLLANVPVMTTRNEDAARRFISLVDEFYDRSVKLIISAAAPIQGLYDGERLTFEFERTRSRLLEMQSKDYLARIHKA